MAVVMAGPFCIGVTMGSVYGEMVIEPEPSSCLYRFCCKLKCKDQCQLYPYSPVQRIKDHVRAGILTFPYKKWAIVEVGISKEGIVVDGMLQPSGKFTAFNRCTYWEEGDEEKAEDYYRHTRKRE